MLKIKFEILIENMERVGGACWTCDVILEGGGGASCMAPARLLQCWPEFFA